MESFSTLGVVLFMFVVLPELNAIQGAMLTNCLCVVPAILGLLARNAKENKRPIKAIVDIVAIFSQVSGFLVWPLLEKRAVLWLIPLACVMTSCGWWENYASFESPFLLTRWLGVIKEELASTRYFNHLFLSLWKITIFTSSVFIIYWIQGEEPFNLVLKFSSSFGPHKILINEISNSQNESTVSNLDISNDILYIDASYNVVVVVLILQILGAYICYVFGKFACKISIQGFSYAFPVSLTIPVSVSLMIAVCGIRIDDPCFFHGITPDYLFFESPLNFSFKDFVTCKVAWIWIFWLLSQTWITLHIWTPKCERLATTEKLFVSPMYNSLLIDQSMAMNRRRDDQADVKTEVRMKYFL